MRVTKKDWGRRDEEGRGEKKRRRGEKVPVHFVQGSAPL